MIDAKAISPTRFRQQLDQAAALLTASWPVKLQRVGPRKFGKRWMARRSKRGSCCKARLFWGDEMTVVIPDAPSETIYTYGLYDLEVTELVAASVRPGACVIDAGAHFGYISLLCSYLAGPTGSVLSIEPTPSTFDILKQNVLAQSTIQAVQAAVGDRIATTTLRDFGPRYAAWNTLNATARLDCLDAMGSGHCVQVQLMTIDDLVQRCGLSPTFIKIDTENYEDRVLVGMADTIRKLRPLVLLEAGSLQGLNALQSLIKQSYALYVKPVGFPISRIINNDGLQEAGLCHKDVLCVPAEMQDAWMEQADGSHVSRAAA